MKKIYKIVVRLSKGNKKYLTLGREVLSPDKDFSSAFETDVAIHKDGSIEIRDNDLEIIYDETSPDWYDYFEYVNKQSINVASIQGHEIEIQSSIKY
jgi:hypothetical protein